MKSTLDLNKIANPALKPSNLYVGGLTRDEVKEKIGSKKLYKLSSNENLLGPSPMALQAIKDNAHLIGEYPDRSDGRLRQALSAYYHEAMSEEQFVCGNSGSEVLEFICRAFLQPGLEYIVSNPCFKPYQMFSDKLGAVLVDVPLIEATGYTLNIEGILGAITERTRLLFLTSPNNPTATYIPRADMLTLLDALPDHIVVVYDEVYARYADAPDYAEATEFVAEGYPVIGLNSFSKLFGLAGLRLGYAYSTPSIAEYIRRLYKPFLLSTLTLEAGIAALGDSVFLKETTDLVKSERPRIEAELTALGMEYWPSQANFVQIRPADDDADTLAEALLLEGIMVRPVAGFGSPGCLRVTIGTVEANNAFLAALAKVLG